ncbi:ParM/StbA family protein [Acidithiobacillus caldus]|uniref:Uncharacterized protein n=2 Tax=Acidithiobacillus caldus TaxID=33059 RepID=F9ZQR5_ACICS|nr:ParM/StbA family protein [Acidithiobacillus caldus]AEK58665.1 conserved hypothetical protein [Acidithiobacillus caldus SM-1]OFC35991.1 hypothetical protein BAE27_06775 [Acidithiobacillus caldus]OFC38353.1 hypothetical protein BAE28_05745 [Acidithiobacillus caldus]OFC40381.1 hypothetical protein BAE29_05360 [Acidithiobacillus caldus]OFC58928.1 hypothetical protein BAE30_08715 [Acidithiobacillus caldus]
MANIVGMDIGYGNLKVAFGVDTGQPQTEIYPATAIPAELVASSLFGGDQEDENGIRVLVDEAAWVAGVPAAAVQRYAPRQLHEGYVGSPAWKALAHAGLLLSGFTEIDVLVVGLPVHHFDDQARRKHLEALLQGTHRVSPRRQLVVHTVRVVPQPVGAYIDALNGPWNAEAEQERLSEETCLVIDPGFFSLDWTLIRAGGRYAPLASGSSLFAVSKVIEEARRRIQHDHGAAPTVAQLEQCLQEHRPAVRVYRQDVPLADYYAKSATNVAKEAFSEMRAMLRQVDEPINYLILAGGGALLYRDSVAELYPNSTLLCGPNPEICNVLGFWQLGAQGTS